MKTAINILFWVGTTVILTYSWRQFYLLYNAEEKVVGIKTYEINGSTINLDAFLEIDNKSDISANITGQYYELFVNNKKISEINITKDVHLNSNGKTVLPVNISFAPKDVLFALLQNMTSFLNNMAGINISIKGVLSLEAGILKMNHYPVDVTFNLKEMMDEMKKKRV